MHALFFLSKIEYNPYKLNFTWKSNPIQTNVEIGNWTLRGAAVKTKDKIILVPKLEQQYGEICQRLPMYSKRWDFKVKIGSSGGHGGNFGLFYSQELCTEDPTNSFHGIGIWTNSSIRKSNKGAIYILNQTIQYSDLENQDPSCYFDFTDLPATIHLKKMSDFLTIELINENEKTICYNSSITLPENGYFSLISYNHLNNDIVNISENLLYSIDVDNFDVHPLMFDQNISKNNRKLLDRYYKTYKTNKLQKQFDFNKTITQILEDFNNSKTFNNSLLLINEIVNKAHHVAPLFLIKIILNSTLSSALETSLKSIHEAYQFCDYLNEQLQEISEITEFYLKNIALSLSDEMKNIQEEAMNFVTVSIKNQSTKKILTSKILKDINFKEDSKIPYILIILCGIELLLYIIFFFYQKQKTKSFKKID